MKFYKRRGDSPLLMAIGEGLVALLSLVGCTLLFAAVLLFLERPTVALPMTALAVAVVSGAISALASPKKRTGLFGVISLVALWLVLGAILGGGRFPTAALVGAASFSASHALCRFLPKKRRRRK